MNDKLISNFIKNRISFSNDSCQSRDYSIECPFFDCDHDYCWLFGVRLEEGSYDTCIRCDKCIELFGGCDL